MNRSVLVKYCCSALCCAGLVFGLACGKYGRPERTAPREAVVSAQAPDSVVSDEHDEDRSEKKSPKR